jgi:hypothetical protein
MVNKQNKFSGPVNGFDYFFSLERTNNSLAVSCHNVRLIKQQTSIILSLET